nr:palindromic element RPE4 domain-containing protein [Rickettsia asembonensis]
MGTLSCFLDTVVKPRDGRGEAGPRNNATRE